MRKILLIFFVLSVCNFANAQFSASSPNGYLQINDLPNIDAVFLFNGITPLTEISYTGTGALEWRKYDNTFYSNQDYISPDDATGYILLIDNVPTYWIWVIDYSLYLINNIQIAPIEQNFCKNLTLNITAPDLVYYDKNNQMKILSRKLDYVDYSFNGETWQDSVPNPLPNITTPYTTISAPKQDVTFTDYFAKEMNIEPSVFLDYRAVAVKSYLKGTVEKRSVPPTDKPNEDKRDNSQVGVVSGSAPLVVEFKSRANTPVAAYFEWRVETPSRTYNYPDENIRYTFVDDVSYKVKLKVTSAYGCTCLDSINVTTEKSYLAAPNFFTPNGDGVNDEFRVAYRSIKNYKCVIFNRWGSVVFTSTDPNKGWDGNVRGKPAAEGTYYYVITATGTDIDNNQNSKNKGKLIKRNAHGAVNLFR